MVIDNYEHTDVGKTEINSYQVPADSWGIKRLQQIFGVDEIARVESESARAKMDVVVGEDWVR